MNTKRLSNWWLLTLNGIIAIVYGIIAIFVPSATLVTLVMYFGIVILIIGFAMLWGAINSIRDKLPYATDLVSSFITIVIGALLTFYTSKSLTIFVMIIGSWAVLVGVVQLYVATKSELLPGEKNTLLVNGIITLVFGIILFFNPFESAKFLVVISGILAFIFGIVLIAISIRLKNVNVFLRDNTQKRRNFKT